MINHRDLHAARMAIEDLFKDRKLSNTEEYAVLAAMLYERAWACMRPAYSKHWPAPRHVCEDKSKPRTAAND
jgi:hypothetical protein